MKDSADPAPKTAFERLCHEQGHPVTVQRRLVFESLARRRDHPTADQVYEDVRAHLPEISRATVYRALETLVEIGAARRIDHHGPAARFEPDSGRHHHLVCTKCQSITDVPDKGPAIPSPPEAAAAGFHVLNATVSFQGLCSLCQ